MCVCVCVCVQGCELAQLDYYLADLLRTADEDGDGLISLPEFLKYVLADDTLTPEGYFADGAPPGPV